MTAVVWYNPRTHHYHYPASEFRIRTGDGATPLSRLALHENPPVDSDGGKSPQGTFGSSVNSSSTVAPRTNTSHSMKQFDFHGFPSTVTLYTHGTHPHARTIRQRPLTLEMTRDTRRTLTNIACGEKFFVWMVVLVLKSCPLRRCLVV